MYYIRGGTGYCGRFQMEAHNKLMPGEAKHSGRDCCFHVGQPLGLTALP